MFSSGNVSNVLQNLRGEKKSPLCHFFSFSLFPCFPLCFSVSIYLSSCSVVSPERLGAASQNVLPLQVIPAFTASVKHSAFFPPMPMNTEGGNAESRSSLSSSLSFSSAQPSFSSLAVFLHLRALRPLFGARCPHFSMLWPPNPLPLRAAHQPLRAVIVIASFS